MNDKNGHEVGTEMIIGLSRLLENKIRPNENSFVARYGGDEFVLVIPGMTEIENVMKRAKDINSLVSATEFRTSKGKIRQTVSLGAGIWDGKESRTELLERVDSAMYEAKKQGRDKVVQAK
jgi:diguanylate cyclase